MTQPSSSLEIVRPPRRKQSLFLICAAVTGVIILFDIAGFFGLQYYHEARIAFSRQLAAQAVSHLDDRLDLALLLGMEAYRVEHTFEAHNSLMTELQHNP